MAGKKDLPKSSKETPPSRPNILLILVDQLRYPRLSYGDAGLANSMKDILPFVGDLKDNPFVKHFPGFTKLREYGVVLTNHSIAESACIPRRASIMTGQYGPRTGVTQTDGQFKSGDTQNFPWLRHDGFATLGDWFKAIGYSTHHFGKWHVSKPPKRTLQGFGYENWELSWPAPHGAQLNNLGTFRDYQFADSACAFLQARGLGVPCSRATSQQNEDHPRSTHTPETKPFLAVSSFTNPHDIAVYPTLPRALSPAFGPGGSVPVRAQGDMSTTPMQGKFQVPLNPTGLPQNCAMSSPTQNEDLRTNNKPQAQYDYSLKVGIRGFLSQVAVGP